MAICELCELELEWCEHGMRAARRASEARSVLLISPAGMAHFPGCPHKGDHDDYSGWAELNVPDAWARIGNGEAIPATGGAKPDLVVVSRCSDCVEHGPWK